MCLSPTLIRTHTHTHTHTDLRVVEGNMVAKENKYGVKHEKKLVKMKKLLPRARLRLLLDDDRVSVCVCVCVYV
jgi:hypothetical protein